MDTMRLAACLLLCGMLTACGGGGGGGGGNEIPAGAFTLSANSATFTALEGDARPPSVSLTMTVTGSGVAGVGAGYTGGAQQPVWLGIEITGAGPTFNVVLSINTTHIAPGQYSSTFALGTGDSNGDILQTRQVTVNYTVIARVAISGNAHSSTFIYGDTVTGETVPLEVTATNRSWAATSDAPWLQVPAATQSGSGTIDATVDVAALVPGQYEGHVTVTNTANPQDFALRVFTVDVQSPVFTVTQQSILLGGEDGWSSAPQTLSFTLSSGAAAHPFAITSTTDSGGDWLDLSATGGLVGAAGMTVQVSAVRGNLTGATYTGQLQVTATVRDLVFSQLVPVTYNIEANRIVVAAAGVGFSSSPAPARSVLTRNVVVFSATGRDDVPWEASSNASWLSVTASGETGDAMTLTANPAGLAADTTHFATVAVTSPDPTVENEETIRVGLHVNSVAPTDVSVTVTSQFTAPSPVEPIVFVNNGGSAITGYNVYDGTVARTFSPPVADAGAMVVGADGQRLYVYDRTNLRVAEVDAVTGDFVRSYASTLDGGSVPNGRALGFFRPAGYPILVTPAGRLYDVGTNVEYQDQMAQVFATSFSVTPSFDSQYLVDHGGSVIRMRRTALSGGRITGLYLFNPGTAQGREGQACISSDNQYVYTASGYPYDFRGTSLATQQLARILPGTNYPNAILCLWNGVIVGGVDGYYYSEDVWIYDGPSGLELARRSSTGGTNANRSLLDRGMAASADATRLITQAPALFISSQASELRFQSLPAEL